MCPPGTFAPLSGGADIAECEPCPAGRVCGTPGISNLTDTTPCPPGHVCGETTTRATEFSRGCPAGYACVAGSSPSNQFDAPCIPGVFCDRSTPAATAGRSACLSGHYCPFATASSSNVEISCPLGTTSRSGLTSLLDCAVETISVCAQESGKYYLAGLTYAVDSTNILLGSDAGDAAHAVAVLSSVDPIDPAGSDAFWVNDTIVMSRACPPSAKVAGLGGSVMVIGQNFMVTPGASLTFCRWGVTVAAISAAAGGRDATAAVINEIARVFAATRGGAVMIPTPLDPTYYIVVPATVFSKYALSCPLPPLLVNGSSHLEYLQALPATLEVAVVGGIWSGKQVTGAVGALAASSLAYSFTPGNRNEAAINPDQETCLLPRIGEGGPVPGPAGERNWFALRGLGRATITADFSHIPAEMVYGDHFRLAIYADPSLCPTPSCDLSGLPLASSVAQLAGPCYAKALPYSPWFTDASVDKHARLTITMLALEDVRLHVEIQLLHGLYLSSVPFFALTVNVTTAVPARARMAFATRGTLVMRPLPPVLSAVGAAVPMDYSWVALYQLSYTLSTSPPLNLPPLYSALSAGRILPGLVVDVPGAPGSPPWVLDSSVAHATEAAYWEPPRPSHGLDFAAQAAAYHENFNDIPGFSAKSASGLWDFTSPPGAPFGFSRLLLPYVPFVSACAGFDSYAPWFALLEDASACSLAPYAAADTARSILPALPADEDLTAVGPLDFLAMPIGDACYRSLSCQYEENLAVPDPNPRWFEVGDQTELLRMLRNPVSLAQFLTNGRAADALVAAEGVDSLVQVLVDRSAAFTQKGLGPCGVGCFPRHILFVLQYYQVSLESKRLLRARVIMSNFDFDVTNTSYTFALNYYPLSYLDLVIAFAFDAPTYVVLFVVVGLLVTAAAVLFWSVNRVASQLELPPAFNFLSFLALTVRPLVVGVSLASIPLGAAVVLIYFVFKGNFWLIGPNDPTIGWGPMGSVPTTWNTASPSPVAVSAAQVGRIGVAFLVTGIYAMIAAARIFVPRVISKHEQDVVVAARRRVGAIRDAWSPTTWKRSHMVLVGLIFAMFLSFCIEISFWNYFGYVQWYFIAGFYVVGIVSDKLLELSLRDAALTTPMSTAFSIMQGLVTFGATNFLTFMISFAVDIACAWGMMVYVGPAADRFMDWAVDFAYRKTLGMRSLLQRNAAITLASEIAAETLAHAQLIANGGDIGNNDSHNVGGPRMAQRFGTVEPIIGVMQLYAADASAVLQQVGMILLFILFRNECGFPTQYSIKATDMVYYLYFALVLLSFKFIWDQFIFSAVESVWGLRIHDYLLYARRRFAQRTTRWKGVETAVDLCVDEGNHNLDTMCFSSQFYFMNFIFTQGIFFVIFGMQVIKYNAYNPFADPGAALLVPACIAACAMLQWTSVLAGNSAGIWALRPNHTNGHQNPPTGGKVAAVPVLAELEAEAVASAAARRIGSGVESARTAALAATDSFRFRFLDYNRPWLLERLPKVLSPRTVRRARPYLLAQLATLLGSAATGVSGNDPVAHAVDVDDEPKPPTTARDAEMLPGQGRLLFMAWLTAARRRMTLRKSVQGIVLRSTRGICEMCLGVGGLMATCTPAIDDLAVAFESSRLAATGGEVNIAAWRAFFTMRASFRTQCALCAAAELTATRLRCGALSGAAVTTTQRIDNVLLVAAAGAGGLTRTAGKLLLLWSAAARHRLSTTKDFGAVTHRIPNRYGGTPQLLLSLSDEQAFTRRAVRRSSGAMTLVMRSVADT